jgi:putative transcriptional regulator
MAIVRKSLKQIAAKPPRIKRKLMKATGEAAIRRQAMEDGEDPKAPMPHYEINLVKAARAQLDMTQRELSTLTKIPVATLRNWEQGRTRPECGSQHSVQAVSA